MKLFILFGVLAMTLASSAQVQPGPPRDDDMQAPPLPTEDEHEREEDFEDFEDEEVQIKLSIDSQLSTNS